MRILEALLEITVFSTVIFCGIMLVKKLFQNRMSPLLHYGIWWILLLRLLLPVTVASPVRLVAIPAYVPGQALLSPAEQESEATLFQPDAPTDGQTARTDAPASPGAGQAMPASAGVFPENRRPALPVATWILIVWLAGAGIGVGYTAVLYLRLQRRIALKAVRPAKHLRALYRQVKGELSVRANVPLVCLYGHDSPGLLFPARVLMPMEALAAMDDGQIKNVLAHELIHYKRRDQAVCVLLSLLNAVYWFHPVVWIAVRRIRADMETACDSAVVQGMTPGEKGDYAALILQLFSRARYRRAVLGMAHGRTKSMAEQRIRGVFMNMKSEWIAKAACGLLAAVLLAGCFTTACVPRRAEAEPAVIGGGDGPTDLQVTDETYPTPLPKAEPVSPLAETLGVPQPWSFDQTSADGLLRVTGELAVVLPNVSAVPTASAVCREVTEADLLRVANAFYGGDVTFTYAAEDTKEYAQKYIQRGRALYDSVIDGTCDNKTPSFLKSVKEQYEAYVKKAETAPSASERRPLQPVFTQRMDIYGDLYPGFQGVAAKGGTDYVVSAANTKRASAVNVAEAHEDWALYYFGTYRTEPEGLSVTKDEAIALATAVAETIDGDLALCHVMTAGLPVDAGAENVWAHPWAWQCIFQRQVNGVGTAYDSRDVGSDMESNVNGRAYEALEIAVDDRGVTNVHWINPMTVTQVVNADTKLIPFEELVEGLADWLRAKYDYDVTRENGYRTLYLRHAELGLMRVGKPGSASYTLEPVWNFFVGFEETPDLADPERLRAAYSGDPAYWNSLTVSAVDGRLIDRDYGA